MIVALHKKKVDLIWTVKILPNIVLHDNPIFSIALNSHRVMPHTNVKIYI